MPLPRYLGQEGQAHSSSFPHPQVWDLREERRAAKLYSSVLCLPQALALRGQGFLPVLSYRELQSYQVTGLMLRPITHTV